MRTRCTAAMWISIVALAVQSGRSEAPSAKPATPAAAEQKAAEHPLDRPVVKPWRTHRDAGHLPLLDPANWQIRGCQTFSPDDIRRAVARDDDVLLATHPAAPADDLDKLPPLLEAKVLDGYLATGFPQTQVRARRAGHQIKVEIVEGPRLNAGRIEITGTKSLDMKQLLARLSQPYIPESARPGAFEPGSDGQTTIVWLKRGNSLQRPKDPAWEIGKPIWFGNAGMTFLRKQMEHACANQGRPDAKFELEIKTDPGSNTARLVVRVTDEGPALVIKQVSVAGCKKNTPQQVIDYLRVKPGTLWTRERELLAKERLWRAARFRRYELTIERLPSSGEATLAVTVQELELAPPISQAPTPMEQAFLNFRDFIGAFSAWEDDLICSSTHDGERFEAIVSPKLGSIFTFQPADVDDDEPAPVHSAAMSTDALALYSQATGRRLVARPLPGNLLITWEFDVTRGEDGEQGWLVFGVGANTWASAPAGSPVLRSLMLAPPVAFMYMARKYEKTSTLNDGILTIGMPDDEEDTGNQDTEGPPTTRIRVLAATGRLLDLTYDCGGEHSSVTLSRDAYHKRAQELEAKFGKKPNEFDPRQPLGSTLAFLTREMDETQLIPDLDDDARGALRVARKALAAQILEPLDESLVRLNAATHDPNLPFYLGSNPQHERNWRNTNAESAYCVWLYSDDWAARGSWLWDLAREAILAGVGLDDYTPMEIAQQLTRDSNGPLANLAAAAVLNEAGAKVAALRFARRGRGALEAAKFRADITSLLDARGLAGRSLLRAGEVLRLFDDQDILWLTNEEPDDTQSLARTLLRELHKDPQRPIAEALPDSLERLWDSHLKQYLEAGLQAYLDAPPRPATPAPRPDERHARGKRAAPASR